VWQVDQLLIESGGVDVFLCNAQVEKVVPQVKQLLMMGIFGGEG